VTLEKTLKKAKERLEILSNSRTTEGDLIREQREIVETLEKQIAEERK
jgi:archaellum component FlaC